MATIEKREYVDKVTGKTVRRFKAKIRLKGFPYEEATFDRKSDAESWAAKREYEIRNRQLFGVQAYRTKTVKDLLDRYAENLEGTNPKRYKTSLPIINVWKARLGSLRIADIVLNPNQSLVERALALWYLAGTDRFPHDNLTPRAGCLEWASEVITALNMPSALTIACIENLARSRYPLSLLMPLFTSFLAELPRPLVVVYDKFDPSKLVNGVPLVAVDGFTRVGKASFLEFSRTVKDLKLFNQKQIALGVFFTQGFCVNQRLSCPVLEGFRQDGEIADMESAGLDLPRHMALREVLTHHSTTLEEIRIKHLASVLGCQQDELFEGE